MKIGIFGAGAVGISIACPLYDLNKYDVYFCATASHSKRIKDGVYLNEKLRCIPTTDKMVMDYLIVAVKNYDLESSLDDISLFVDKNTVILPLLNGIEAHDILKKRFVLNRVLYGMIRIEANMNGVYVNASKIGLIAFGERFNPDVAEYIKPLKKAFDEANISNEVSGDMMRSVWLKWMLNIGINQVSALTNSTYRDMHHKYLQELLYNLFLEIVALAAIEGVDIKKEDADFFIKESLTWDSNRFTSMAIDMQEKRECELEYFSGTALRLAKKRNMSLPYNEFMYKCLKAIYDNYKNK